MQLHKTSIPKTHISYHFTSSSRLPHFLLTPNSSLQLAFLSSVKTIRFCHGLCEKIIFLLSSLKLCSAAVSCHCGVRSMQPSSTLFTSSFHQDQYPWVLLLSSSAVLLHITSIQIFRLILHPCFTTTSVCFTGRCFCTAHFVTPSLAMMMSRWGLHN